MNININITIKLGGDTYKCFTNNFEREVDVTSFLSKHLEGEKDFTFDLKGGGKLLIPKKLLTSATYNVSQD